jgi:hypothetical protein
VNRSFTSAVTRRRLAGTRGIGAAFSPPFAYRRGPVLSMRQPPASVRLCHLAYLRSGQATCACGPRPRYRLQPNWRAVGTDVTRDTDAMKTAYMAAPFGGFCAIGRRCQTAPADFK